MGAWGYGLLQSDHDYDCAGNLSDEAGIELFYPEDPEATRKKLDDGTLSRLFDNHENRTFSPKCTTIILGVLAMQVGAKIEDRHLDLLRSIYRSAGLYEEGERQMRKALERYKNDGTPYSIDSPGLDLTVALKGPMERGEIPRLCTNCDKSETELELKRCGKCKVVLYCSPECQKADWKTHKRFCRPAPDPQPVTQSPSGIIGLNVDPFHSLRDFR
ncbi:hypothetical protein W97_02777 [Coniosporium apollinis CBS 100218]|uniref:MYND-type domain-containing protein n=1 Tax=Coniosporium apollinis (strain CBS 100218) TaxID=1168221 RepID=R7YP04_CONA1|nr:uncharacterized protein W97_02777 [Coniosporium apollinis CBS 100218]EON63549.1 hypothetical protein W97_02777 [Coniosporium apollinis CBS 100218]